MRNIFRFLWKYYFLILFLTLEVFSGALIVQNNNFQHASFINSANSFSADIYSSVNNVSEYFSLKQSNEVLATENALLHNYTKDAFYDARVRGGSSIDTVLKQQYTFISAKVVNNSVNKRNNYLT